MMTDGINKQQLETVTSTLNNSLKRNLTDACTKSRATQLVHY